MPGQMGVRCGECGMETTYKKMDEMHRKLYQHKMGCSQLNELVPKLYQAQIPSSPTNA